MSARPHEAYVYRYGHCTDTSAPCHRTDIPLSSKTNRLYTPTSKLGKEVARYTPPCPAQGSKRHRYVTLLFEQSDTAPAIQIAEQFERSAFPLREFVQEHALEPAGIHFFRCEWTPYSEKTISQAWYRSRWGQDEEQWGNISRKERKDSKGDVRRRDAAEEAQIKRSRGMLKESEKAMFAAIERSDLSPEKKEAARRRIAEELAYDKTVLGMKTE